MFRFFAALMMSVLVFTGMTVPAEAHDNRDCVTKTEFRRLQESGWWDDKGDTYRQVKRKLDGPGIVTLNNRHMKEVAYYSCRPNQGVMLFFGKKASGKTDLEFKRRFPLGNGQSILG